MKIELYVPNKKVVAGITIIEDPALPAGEMRMVSDDGKILSRIVNIGNDENSQEENLPNNLKMVIDINLKK